MTALWPRGHLVGGRRVEHWDGQPRPWAWRKPRLVIVDEGSLFTDPPISAVEKHRFLVITSSPDRHLFMGCIRAVAVFTQDDADRDVEKLMGCPARWRAVVLDGSGAVDLSRWLRERRVPMFPVGAPDLVIPALDLVVVAGQVGKGAAPCDLANVRALRDQCAAARVGFVIARMGPCPRAQNFDDYRAPVTHLIKRRSQHSRDGRDPSAWPADLKPYAAAAGPLAGGEL